MRRQHRRLVVLAILAILVVAVAAVHADQRGSHMAEDGMAEVVSVCLAVLEVGLGMIAAVLAVMYAPGRRWPQRFGRPHLADVPRRPGLSVRVRAGPPALQVFLR